MWKRGQDWWGESTAVSPPVGWGVGSQGLNPLKPIRLSVAQDGSGREEGLFQKQEVCGRV